MLKRKLIDKLTDEKGSGLVLALMVLLVLSVLGASLGVVTIGSLQLSTANRDTNSAYYIAEAGVNMAYKDLEESVSKSYESNENYTAFYTSINNDIKEFFSEKKYDGTIFSKQHGEHPTAKVNITKEDTGEARKYKIQSTGEVDDKKRTVEKEVVVKWRTKFVGGGSFGFPDGAAIVASKKLELDSKITIDGDLYLEGKTKEKYKKYVNGTIKQEYEKFDEYFGNVVDYVKKLRDYDYSKLDLFTLKAGENTTEKLYYKAGKVDFEEKKGTINIGNNNVVIFMDELELDDATLEIIGEGTLTLVVSGEVEFENGSVFNPTGKNVRIVSTATEKEGDDSEVDIEGGSIVYAQIIAPFTVVEIEDDSSVLHGNIIAKKVELEDKVSVIYKSFDFGEGDIGVGAGSGEEESEDETEGLIQPGPTLEINKQTTN